MTTGAIWYNVERMKVRNDGEVGTKGKGAPASGASVQSWRERTNGKKRREKSWRQEPAQSKFNFIERRVK